MATTKDTIREQIAKDSKVKPMKVKRKRKPMSEEQKSAAIERLAKARAKKIAEQGGPKSVHPDVFALPDDDPLSVKNVRQWINVQKEEIKAIKAQMRKDAKMGPAKLSRHEGYVRSLERYIREGIYTDMFYGERMEGRMASVCIVPAYDKDGNIKRSQGVFYRDIGGVYMGPGKIKRDGEIVEADYI